jgi:hypothetical protein
MSYCFLYIISRSDVHALTNFRIFPCEQVEPTSLQYTLFSTCVPLLLNRRTETAPSTCFFFLMSISRGVDVIGTCLEIRERTTLLIRTFETTRVFDIRCPKQLIDFAFAYIFSCLPILMLVPCWHQVYCGIYQTVTI